MTESLAKRIIREQVCAALRREILSFLEKRFGVLPADLAIRLESITGEGRLVEIADQAGVCSTLDAFLSKLGNA